MRHSITTIILSAAAVLFIISSCTSPQQDWQQVASGVWTLSAGTPDEVNLTNQLHITPQIEAINAMSDAGTALPLSPDDISIEVRDGKTFLRFPLEEGEEIYGLGLNFKTVRQRGRIMRLHVDHYSENDDGRTHAPVPFFISTKGYGVFINAARYIDVWCGTSVRKDSANPPVPRDRTTDPEWTASPYSDNLEFLIPAAGVELVMFAGPTMLDVVRRFNLYHGGGVLPPKWGLGFWQRVPTPFTDRQVLEEVKAFKDHRFPLSVIGLEPGWQSLAYPCSYDWDPQRFPDPKGFLDTLASKGVRTNLWINPGISERSSIYEAIEPWTASHTEWCGVVPDYTLPQARKILTDHWGRCQLDAGVSGFKMDENDGIDNWIFPDVASFPSGTSAEQMRQIYGLLMQDTQNQMFRRRNQRTYGLVRASNGGSSPMPYVIYNDYYDHRGFITALINSSFIGVLWTPEVRSSDTAEEWLRRIQTVCFSPMAMINAWSDGTEPWTFPEVAQQVSDMANLRMKLLPYLYTSFADYCFQGIPPVRAMNLEEGWDESGTITEKGTLDSTENPYAIAAARESKDQFMVGPSLLVAPLFAGETEREVILPEGKWFDFYTGEPAGEGGVIKVAPGLDRIPVYVKDGGIIPMFSDADYAEGKKMPIEVRHYGEKPSSYELYDDDGVSFDYEKGEYSIIPINVSRTASGLKGTVEFPAEQALWSYSGEYTFRFMTTDAGIGYLSAFFRSSVFFLS